MEFSLVLNPDPSQLSYPISFGLCSQNHYCLSFCLNFAFTTTEQPPSHNLLCVLPNLYACLVFYKKLFICIYNTLDVFEMLQTHMPDMSILLLSQCLPSLLLPFLYLCNCLCHCICLHPHFFPYLYLLIFLS